MPAFEFLRIKKKTLDYCPMFDFYEKILTIPVSFFLHFCGSKFFKLAITKKYNKNN